MRARAERAPPPRRGRGLELSSPARPWLPLVPAVPVGYTRPVPTGAGSFFDAMAASYDDLEPWYEHLYGVLHGLLRAELGRSGGAHGSRALDAGCGTGFQTAILLELGYETLGLDLSAGLLDEARRRCAGARLVQGDLATLPWRDGTVDLAVCCGSTLSFVGDARRAVQELARVLRPGGRLFLEVEQRWSLDLLWRLASSLTGDPLGYAATPAEARRAFGRPFGHGIWLDYPGYPRLRLFTPRELDTLLVEVGLAPLRWWGIHSVTNLVPSTILHRPRLGGTLGRLYRALARMDRMLAGTSIARCAANSLVVLARKPDARSAQSSA